MSFTHRPLVIAGRSFQSRLILGTGKFSSPEAMREAIAVSGAEMVTVALRRADLSGKKDPFANILEYLDGSRYLLLPNTSGAMNAEEAVRLARLAAAAGLPKWIKLEIHPDPRYLLPDPVETFKAAEIRELGFEYAELSHGIRISLVPGILEAVKAGEIKISSVHNFCPLPLGVNTASPNLYQFSAERGRERELAVRHTLKTLEFAEKVGAQAVVLHLGSIEMKDYTRKLIDMVERGERDTPRYERLCAEMDEKREAKKGPFFNRVKECLRQIAPEAASRGLKLGAENREAVEELPFEGDFRELFKNVDNPALGYWHDTGHAQIKENLGLVPHSMLLSSMATHLVGLHIHDVRFPARDHSYPGSGCIDFAGLKPLVGPNHIRVFEFSPSMAPEHARAGVAHIHKAWDSA